MSDEKKFELDMNSVRNLRKNGGKNQANANVVLGDIVEESSEEEKEEKESK